MLAAIEYVPVLRTKVAEVDAYRNLSNGVKDATLPVFLARPFPNAGHLSHTVKKVGEAVDDRPFGFGLDYTRQRDSNPRAAQTEFQSLFSPDRGYANYFQFVNDADGAVPVLQPSSNSDNLLLQLGRAEDLDRGLIVHITREFFPPVLNIAGRIPPLPHDTTFIIDAGWSRDYAVKEAWLAATIRRITSVLTAPELVTCGSSFPDSFNDIVGSGAKSMHERRLHDSMRRQFNTANITYGDWGSTREEQSGGGGIIPPRIDVPRPNGWEIFRADSDLAETYDDMARLAEVGEGVRGMPDCYGKRMILATPGPGGITGTAMSTRARINMHLTLHSGSFDTIDTEDELYED